MNWKKVLYLAEKGNLPPDVRVEKSDDAWRKQLTPEQYHVTRNHGTERPWSGAYCEAHDPGLYGCVCCGTTLFDARVKFDSGTGWPSFSLPVAENVIKYHLDNSFGMQRVEVCCNVCDAHLGHVFPDGPPPSGLRFCINSLALNKL
jgi:methionine-R-sulfoxide reductase